uniref:Putative F-box protein PP2-B2 n=1 Tax=Noccaea caerulescens TaxID=107243 RepID=A0A1J3HT60_NOCCA
MNLEATTMGQKHGVESRVEATRCGGGGEIISFTGPSPFDLLPEDCISNIISFTSPRDACVAACVSKTFESAVNSDSVWEKFLPLDYASLIPQSRVFTSKKELYIFLCDDPRLIEDGKKSFWLEKASGKKCIMVSSKEVWITWGSSPQYWQWITIPESRFEKIAELLNVCWFEVRAGLHTRYLSPQTRYSVYIVFKTKNRCPGLGDIPVEVSVGLVGQESSQKLIYFVGPVDRRRDRERRDVARPEERRDGWMEAELGEFYNEACCDDTSVSVVEIKSPYWKRGLIIQGIEFRPTKNQ